MKPSPAPSRLALMALPLAFPLLLLLGGCASPGPPRPPSLHIPDAVSDLTAQRSGRSVLLHFEAPVRTTDRELLQAPVTASLCRAVADGPCRPTTSFPAKVVIAGSVDWVDTLPPDLASGPPSKLTYKVETFNPRGRSAGPSEPVFAPAGQAPPAVAALRVAGSRSGIVLRWSPDAAVPEAEVLLKREQLNAPAPPKATASPSAPAAPNPAKKTLSVPHGAPAKKHHGASSNATLALAASSADPNIVWLRAEGSQGADAGGMVDASARTDAEYRYTAVRSRFAIIDGRRLETRSEPSAPVTLTLRDVYPPAAPQGLLAAGFPQQAGLAVDLIWQPNLEPDIAGYIVYRQAVGSDAPPLRLNEKPLPLPAFHDTTAARAVAYRYTVTALDAKGNESPASAPAELAPTP